MLHFWQGPNLNLHCSRISPRYKEVLIRIFFYVLERRDKYRGDTPPEKYGKIKTGEDKTERSRKGGRKQKGQKEGGGGGDYSGEIGRGKQKKSGAAFASKRRREDIERLRSPHNRRFSGPLQSSTGRACVRLLVTLRDWVFKGLAHSQSWHKTLLSLSLAHTPTGSHVYIQWRARLSRGIRTQARTATAADGTAR